VRRVVGVLVVGVGVGGVVVWVVGGGAWW